MSVIVNRKAWPIDRNRHHKKFKQSHEYKKLKRQLIKKQKKEYSRYIGSPKWTNIRNELSNEDTACEGCGSKSNLNLHHLTYKHLKNEVPEELMWLCDECHKAVHWYQKHGKKSLLMATSLVTNIDIKDLKERLKITELK